MNILICENSDSLRTSLNFRLSKHSFHAEFATNYTEASSLIQEKDFGIIIIDVDSEDGSLFIKKHLINENNHIPYIVISKISNRDRTWKYLNEGASDFINKPYVPAELILRIRRQIENKRATM